MKQKGALAGMGKKKQLKDTKGNDILELDPRRETIRETQNLLCIQALKTRFMFHA